MALTCLQQLVNGREFNKQHVLEEGNCPYLQILCKVNLKIKQKDLTTDWYNGHKKLLTVNTPEELQPQQRRHGIKQQKSEQNREEEKGANDQKCKLWSPLTYQ